MMKMVIFSDYEVNGKFNLIGVFQYFQRKFMLGLKFGLNSAYSNQIFSYS